MNRLTVYLSGVALLVLASCGGGGGGGSSAQTGQLVDSTVSGIDYTAGQKSGVTDAQGHFSYPKNSTVVFSIGDIVLPSAAAAQVLTPVQLVAGAQDELDPTVTNIARFLQTIDDDGNPSNGIKVTDAVNSAANGLSVNFNQTIDAFEADSNVVNVVAALTAVTHAGQRSLVSAAEAQSHLQQSLLTLLSGHYEGSFDGGDTGTWSLDVTSDGVITGTGYSNNLKASFAVEGTLTSAGQAGFATGGTSTGAVFAGTFSLLGAVEGVWSNDSAGIGGTFQGAKKPQ